VLRCPERWPDTARAMPLIHRTGGAFDARPDDYVAPSARERWRQAWHETRGGAESQIGTLLRPVVAVAVFVNGWVRDRRLARRG
jgi:hypothetical protein